MANNIYNPNTITTSTTTIKSNTTSSLNVSSLVNPNIISTLNTIQLPKNFGNQLKNLTNQKIIQAATESTLAKLEKEKILLIEEGILLDTNHQLHLQEIEKNHLPSKKIENGIPVDIPPKLNDKEYKEAIAAENANYLVSKTTLDKKKEDNQEAINTYLKDPFKKQKEERKRIQNLIKRTSNKADIGIKQSKKDRTKNLVRNTAKNLAPIIISLITDRIVDIISQNNKLQKLVDDTNAIILDANESGDATKLNNAKIARDNAITIIQNNENKLIQIQKQIENISTYLNIFTLVVNILGPILLPIPTPSPAPDVVTTPKENFRIRVYEPAVRILNDLSAYLPMVLTVFERAIAILEDLKSQLLEINGQLDVASTSQIPGTTSLLSGTENGITLGIFPIEYKGFKFAIREENNPKFVVRGYKRHYAEAIDSNNVAVLKSESSFTLDPNDLIDQLKLIIDRENLIA